MRYWKKNSISPEEAQSIPGRRFKAAGNALKERGIRRADAVLEEKQHQPGGSPEHSRTQV